MIEDDDFMTALLKCIAEPDAQMYEDNVPIYTHEIQEGNKRGKKVWHIEHTPTLSQAAKPEKYYGGIYKFRPIESCAEAMKETLRRGHRFGFEPVCLTCQEILMPEYMTSVENDGETTLWRVPLQQMFGVASDHAMSCLNHCVEVRHIETKIAVWRSAYSILKTQSEPYHEGFSDGRPDRMLNTAKSVGASWNPSQKPLTDGVQI